MSYGTTAQLNSEAAVIGSICIDAKSWEIAGAMLKPEHFVSSQARTAFERAMRLVESGHKIDPILIAEGLSEGGRKYIASCMTSTPTAANVKEYCEAVIVSANRRKLGEMADELNDRYLDDTVNPAEVLEEMRSKIDALTATSVQIDNSAQIADAWKRNFTAVKSNPEHALCMSRYSSLDVQLGGGFYKTGFYVIGARPGMGKTTLAINLCERIAAAGKKVLFISLEMSDLQIMSKRIALLTGLSYTRLMTAQLNDEDAEFAFEAAEQLAQRPFVMTDKSGITTTDIARLIRATEDVKLVVIDYIGLIKPKDSSVSKLRYEQMTEISAELKGIAKTLNVPIVVLAQLNRENASRMGNRPKLTDLRDSGSIEQDADGVILLHRSAYYKRTDDDYTPTEIEEIELIVAKSRHGTQGVVTMTWQGSTGRINEYDTRYAQMTEINDTEELPF